MRTLLDLVYSFVLQLPLPLKGSWTKANLVSRTTKMLITTKKMCPCIFNIHIHTLCRHTFKHTHASAHTSPHQYSLYRSFHTLVRSVGYKFNFHFSESRRLDALGYWKWQAEHLAEAWCVHLHPINAIFYGRPSPYGRLSFLGKGFLLRCFQELS